ncbi:unnamed protein product [Rhizophagus irregularis]|nr:unnamed protein product [Rhizophagus irregularis]
MKKIENSQFCSDKNNEYDKKGLDISWNMTWNWKLLNNNALALRYYGNTVGTSDPTFTCYIEQIYDECMRLVKEDPKESEISHQEIEISKYSKFLKFFQLVYQYLLLSLVELRHSISDSKATQCITLIVPYIDYSVIL